MRRDTRQACVPHSLPCSHRKVTCTHIKKAAIYSSKRELSPETNQIGTLILNLQHWEKINFCYLSHWVYIWFWQHKLTSTKDECHSWVHERVDSGNRENVVLSQAGSTVESPFLESHITGSFPSEECGKCTEDSAKSHWELTVRTELSLEGVGLLGRK